MDAPDLEVAALLVDSEFFLHVVFAGRAGPDLDNQRQWLVVDLEDILQIEEWQVTNAVGTTKTSGMK